MKTKAKKKNTTTSKKIDGRVNNRGHRPKGKVLIIPEYNGQDPHIDLRPPPKPDIEETLPEPKDKLSKHKYPPPKKNPVFREKWGRFVDNVIKRDNFNVAHLDTLEILCDLYVEYDELQRFVRVNGRSYVSHGRMGEVWKFYPEVGQLARTQAQIKEYSKMLGLLLKKDHGNESGGESEEWK